MIERQRLPSCTYHSLHEEDEQLRRDSFAEQPIAILSAHKDIQQVARHVAQGQKSDSPFFVMDVAAVHSQVDLWHDCLPSVKLCYALRCNADPVLAKLLADQNIAFEVANSAELELAKSLIHPQQIIFNCQLLTRKSMKMAGEANVGTIVIESAKQLEDAVQYAPYARIIIALCLGPRSTMGCDMATAEEILERASDLRANVTGVCFHLGAGQDASAYYKALREVRLLFDTALSRYRINLRSIGLGGGFQAAAAADIEYANEDSQFHKLCYVINESLSELFPISQFPQLNAFATPGRFLAAPAFSLCTAVTGKRALDAKLISNDDFDEGIGYVYSTNDGLYGSFGCRLLDCQPQCKPLFEGSGQEHISTVLGPSLEAVDVAQSLVRVRQLRVGEWLLWPNMGAYSIPLDSDRPAPPVFYYAGQDKWSQMTRKCSLYDLDSRSDGASDVESLSDECELALFEDVIVDSPFELQAQQQ
ncbi:hypothetical protein WR25_01381 isoform A [Diploscapter pachys]|uniref:Orn/DAP/Arg decarboxylase 2 N-terminal domain-containing protein n=2 Tax=Diploscapter pachys TaxID=2018661 RepID=A0A2A2K7Q5_9BILA|nr:hypothetical protein WR25_01381 isoform A [Diploscapter pachys]